MGNYRQPHSPEVSGMQTAGSIVADDQLFVTELLDRKTPMTTTAESPSLTKLSCHFTWHGSTAGILGVKDVFCVVNTEVIFGTHTACFTCTRRSLRSFVRLRHRHFFLDVVCVPPTDAAYHC